MSSELFWYFLEVGQATVLPGTPHLITPGRQVRLLFCQVLLTLVHQAGRSGSCSARYSSPCYTRQVGHAPVLPGNPHLVSPGRQFRLLFCKVLLTLFHQAGKSGSCSARYSSPCYTRQVGQAPVLLGTTHLVSPGRYRSGSCSPRYSSPCYTRQVGQAPVLPGTPPQLASPPPRPRSQSCRCCCSLGLGTHRNHLDTPGNKSFLTCNRVGHYCRANRLISNLY